MERYLEGSRKHRFRLVILVAIFMANVCFTLSSRNIIYAIQPMLNHTALEGKYAKLFHEDHDGNGTGTCRVKQNDEDVGYQQMKDGPYLFSSTSQALMLSAVAIGKLLGAIMALFIYDFVYLGPVLVVSTLWIGLLNVLIPFFAAKTGSFGIIFSRLCVGIYIGLLTPANNVISTKWFTRKEKNMANAIFSSGANVGNILFCLSGMVNSWELLFWIPGGAAMVMSILLLIIFTDDPEINRFVHPVEKDLLERHRKLRGDLDESYKRSGSFRVSRKKRRDPAPWCKKMKNLGVWSLLLGSLGYYWACEATITYTQIYLMQIHNYSLSKASLLNTVPTNISIVVFGILATKAADYCLQKDICDKTTVRRVGGLFLLMTGVFFLLMGTLPCHAIDKAIIALMIFSSFRSGVYISILPAITDISPTYQDQLYTLCMVSGFIPGFAVPSLIGIVGKETRSDWLIIFIFSAGTIFLSVGFFIFTISSEIQGFDVLALKNLKQQQQSKTEPSSLEVPETDTDVEKQIEEQEEFIVMDAVSNGLSTKAE